MTGVIGHGPRASSALMGHAASTSAPRHAAPRAIADLRWSGGSEAPRRARWAIARAVRARRIRAVRRSRADRRALPGRRSGRTASAPAGAPRLPPGACPRCHIVPRTRRRRSVCRRRGAGADETGRAPGRAGRRARRSVKAATRVKAATPHSAAARARASASTAKPRLAIRSARLADSAASDSRMRRALVIRRSG